MILKNIFAKPVERPIEGVIKADDEASLRLEVEEYVLTNEVEKRLEDFLSAYNNYQNANGVWVSGFFGSGKSHLLKMLALLLENRDIEGAKTLDLFLPKCTHNNILSADLRRAIAIPSKSILFNIDQKADVISKADIDALLSVFVKVFNEACGYYDKHPYIAQFERELDRDGLFEQFKQHFEQAAGNTWEWARMRANRSSKQIDEAFNKTTGQNLTDVLDRYRQDYRLSIEDFAEQVQEYIEQQPANFRLNFFVDEVGQYVADNTKLMTNLQTIAESLATKCRGRAWIIVTAQEDMSTVVGEMTKEQANDFSKIQARFANRMKLTSADVAEVIQKRLLTKTNEGAAELSKLYAKQSNNFKTLFEFGDGAQTHRNFRDEEHFISSYPFIPYQFSLFQSVIQNLSVHNAFEGKHSSVGERSMLGVFQQVAKQISNHEIGELATFDLMFAGIRNALVASIQKAIIHAENHLDDQFAIKVLKALFLVKYVKEFKPTVRNLCVLMLESFDQDLPALKKRIDQALNLLEQQTYIQRNGDLYDYLTDEEKDVEQEIKNTEVETSDVSDELIKIIFDQIIVNRKIRYEQNGQDYSFSRKMDDRLYGRESELAIHIISPFHEHAENEQMLRSNSAYRLDELFVLIPADERLMRDLIMLKRTEKYIRQNMSVTQQETVKRILTEKNQLNNQRYQDLQQRLRGLLGRSKLMVGGADIDIGSEDGQTRIMRGFQELINRAYPHLVMLRGINYTEDMVRAILQNKDNSLFGTDATSLSEAEQEMLSFILSNSKSGVRTTLKSVLDKFERKPYGWYYAAVLCILAQLFARGKIEVRADSNLLDDSAFEQAILNSREQNNLVLEPQEEFSASQVRALKEFYQDFFDAQPHANEAKALGQETGEAFRDLINQLTPLQNQAVHYPFLNAITPGIDKLNELKGKPYAWYLKELGAMEDELLDLKESIFDPIRRFMNGPQKAIYDEVSQYLNSQSANFSYVTGDTAAQLQQVLQDLQCFKGNKVQQMKAQLDQLKEQIKNLVETTRSNAVQQIQTLQERMQGLSEYQGLPDVRQSELNEPFTKLINHINDQTLVAVVNDALRTFEESAYPNILDKLARLATPAPSQPEAPSQPGKPIAEPPAQYIQHRQISVDFNKPWLADEQDLDRYLQAMREAMLKQIQQGKRIRI